MLSYVYRNLCSGIFTNVAGEEFDNIHDLFAAILVLGVGNQIKRGLHRDYVLHEESLTNPRGKFCITQSLKQQTFIQKKVVCSFDELTENTIYNQILKCTLLLLLKHGEVKPKNRNSIRKILFYFRNVTNIKSDTIRWDAILFHRNNAAYEMLINICQLVVKGLLQTTTLGSYHLNNWFNDEIMYKIYEKFVLAYYIKEFSQYKTGVSIIDWNITADKMSIDTTYLPRMKTDITITHKNKNKTLIIDTKWYSSTMQKNQYGDKKKFHSHNLYQIFAYVKNMDKNNIGNVAGILLYAKTNETITPNNTYEICGNTISIKTLELDQEWKIICEQLNSLCEWLESD
jgi:5-methylcytosine-specific restriction enzyme subunit McrC